MHAQTLIKIFTFNNKDPLMYNAQEKLCKKNENIRKKSFEKVA
jgi:hypothetical protein